MSGASAKRRGITTLIVLMLISVTMALSYAIVRSQMSALGIQRNSMRRDTAYQAALAGISHGLRKMHRTSWAGVDVALTGTISQYDSYQVTFTTGDAALSPASPDYADYPYRVTLLSTGSSADPTHGTTTTRRIQAVVRLVPTRLGSQPTDWTAMQQFTMYQTDHQPFTFNVPCRIEGPVRVQGTVSICPDYSWSTAARSRYMSDLTAMAGANLGQYRPLTGPVSLPFSRTDAATRSLMSGELGLSLTNIAETSEPTLPCPNSLGSYRIYTGGKLYFVPQVSSTLQNQTLQPDPLTNPLGLYFAPSSAVLGNNVTVRGTLITADNVNVNGSVHFLPFDLRPLRGSNLPVRLPAAVAQDDFIVSATGSGDVAGLVLARNRFLIDVGPASATFGILGRLVSEQLVIRGRTQWNLSSLVWTALWNAFNAQLALPPNRRINYFPVWLSTLGLSPQPLLTINPDATPVTFHWQDPTQPFYVADPADGGLRWDLVRWTDNP